MEQAIITTAQLTGLQKAAIVLIALGQEKATQILSRLESKYVERIVREIARMNELDDAIKQQVLEEFRERCEVQDESKQGGLKLALELVKKVMDPKQAEKFIELLKQPEARNNALAALQKAEVKDIVGLIIDEHPQAIALVLCNLAPEKSAAVLAEMPAALRMEVAMRVAKSDAALPKVTSRLAQALERKASARRSDQQVDVQSGKIALVEIMKNVDRSTERSLMENLSDQDPELASFLREKLFVYEDLAKLSPRHVQLLIREVDQDDLRTAMRGSSDEIKDIIFSNMSEGAREALKEDLEVAQPVRLKDVEEAQRRVAVVLRRMAQAGTILVGVREEEYV